MNRIQRLLKLHKLYKPADEHGSDTGGTDTALEELDEGQDDAGDGEEGESGSAEEGEEGEGEAEGVVITIGEEPAAAEDEEQARAPEWVRDLRKSNREKDRVIRELQAKVSQATPSPAAVVLGAKPTLAACDFDEAKFETDLTAWHERKQEVEAQQRTREAAEQKSKEAWQTKLADYNKSKSAMKVKDFEDAEEVAKSILSITQQGIIVAGSKNSALLTYAIGKNPNKAKELAALNDPVQFAWEVAQLETKLKVTPRKMPPPPDRQVRGGASGSAVDSALQRLQTEADKTGDRSKVAQYIRQKKARQTA